MRKLPATRFHLVFSLLMGLLMISLMTLVITLINVGLADDFVARWLRAFLVAYAVGVPVIYFVAPLARRLAGRFAEMPPPAMPPRTAAGTPQPQAAARR